MDDLAGNLALDYLDRSDWPTCPVLFLPGSGGAVQASGGTFYLLAGAFDDDPFQILHWRGRDRQALLERLRALRDPDFAAPSPDRFWLSPVPLPDRPPTLDTEPDLLLRQLPRQVWPWAAPRCWKRSVPRTTASHRRTDLSDIPCALLSGAGSLRDRNSLAESLS